MILLGNHCLKVKNNYQKSQNLSNWRKKKKEIILINMKFKNLLQVVANKRKNLIILLHREQPLDMLTHMY